MQTQSTANGFFGSISSLFKAEGVRFKIYCSLFYFPPKVSGFYKGVTSPLLGIALWYTLRWLPKQLNICSNSVLFASNGFFKKHIFIPDLPAAQQPGNFEFLKCFNFYQFVDRVLLTGMLSGGVMAVINCPVELLKVRMQVQNKAQTSPVCCIVDSSPIFTSLALLEYF